jgi:hypothetical protein
MERRFICQTRFLPPRPNLEQYKKLAKDFQSACKLGDSRAVRAWLHDGRKPARLAFDWIRSAQFGTTLIDVGSASPNHDLPAYHA